MRLTTQEIEQILSRACAGSDFAELYYEHRVSSSLIWVNQALDEISQGVEEGASIRVVQGEKTLFGHSNEVNFHSLMSLAETLNHHTQEKSVTLNELLVAPTQVKQSYETVELAEKIALLKLADDAAQKSAGEFLQQFYAAYRDVTKTVIIANSHGEYTKQCIERGVYQNTVILSKEGDVQTGYDSLGTTYGFDFFTQDKILEKVKEAIRIATLLLDAVPAVSGVMDVIIAGKAGGTMIHEACGHGLELDLVQEEVSIFRKYEGEKIASEKLTVMDGGTFPGLYGSSYFDDEGNPTQESVLIEKGVVKNFMNSRKTAEKKGVAYTGNGRRESYKKLPLPRMRNTYVQPGNDSLEAMLATTKNGLYVTKMGGGQVDTLTGEFVFSALEAYKIEDGKITTPVRNATLQSDGKKVLANITHIGNDLQFCVGTCGKSGQGVPVSSGQPTLKMTGIVVGGSECSTKQ